MIDNAGLYRGFSSQSLMLFTVPLFLMGLGFATNTIYAGILTFRRSVEARCP
jgi:hypothetical protein